MVVQTRTSSPLIHFKLEKLTSYHSPEELSYISSRVCFPVSVYNLRAFPIMLWTDSDRAATLLSKSTLLLSLSRTATPTGTLSNASSITLYDAAIESLKLPTAATFCSIRIFSVNSILSSSVILSFTTATYIAALSLMNTGSLKVFPFKNP